LFAVGRTGKQNDVVWSLGVTGVVSQWRSSLTFRQKSSNRVSSGHESSTSGSSLGVDGSSSAPIQGLPATHRVSMCPSLCSLSIPH
jgi:hypothetical protein